jgi:hypothetical protein
LENRARWCVDIGSDDWDGADACVVDVAIELIVATLAGIANLESVPRTLLEANSATRVKVLSTGNTIRRQKDE